MGKNLELYLSPSMTFMLEKRGKNYIISKEELTSLLQWAYLQGKAKNPQGKILFEEK